MKKLLFKIIIILIAIIALWAGFNLLTDISEPEFEAAKGYNTENIISFLSDLFPPIPIEKDNGFYKLWTLAEPPDVDINSEKILNIQKKLNDPENATAKMIREWRENKWNKNKKAFNKDLKNRRQEIFKRSSPWDNYPQFANKDWGQIILKEKKAVLEMQNLMQPLINRYEDALNTVYFEDYTIIVLKGEEVNFSAPVPNLLTWLYVSKQYTAISILNALEGDWENATANMLKHIQFAKKAVKGSRTLITNLVAKAVMKISIWGIASIMNQPDCPDEVFELVLTRLNDIDYSEYGSEKPILAEGFFSTQNKKLNPFWQTNRTKKYLYEFLTRLINSEKIPPYKWDTKPNEPTNFKKGFFWWIQNPLGKNFFAGFNMNFPTVILKSIHLKTMYDMVRISAELHLKYDSEKTVQENLNSLDLYNSLIDPCSGKPYKWHDKKQMLYSFGGDRDDDGGKDGPLKSWDADFFIPVHLYVK